MTVHPSDLADNNRTVIKRLHPISRLNLLNVLMGTIRHRDLCSRQKTGIQRLGWRRFTPNIKGHCWQKNRRSHYTYHKYTSYFAVHSLKTN